MLIGLGLESGLGLVMHYSTPKAKVLGKPFQFFCLTLFLESHTLYCYFFLQHCPPSGLAICQHWIGLGKVLKKIRRVLSTTFFTCYFNHTNPFQSFLTVVTKCSLRQTDACPLFFIMAFPFFSFFLCLFIVFPVLEASQSLSWLFHSFLSFFVYVLSFLFWKRRSL